jgi:hypothetical protein
MEMLQIVLEKFDALGRRNESLEKMVSEGFRHLEGQSHIQNQTPGLLPSPS